MLPAGLRARFQDEVRLGAGGMGQVWRARDRQLDRDVAIKLVHGVDVGAAELRARFAGEALALSRLDHPHVLRLFDHGEDEGVSYLVTEYLEGPSFGALPETTDPRPGWFQVAEGLQAAHDAGLLHRDVKLENALLVGHRGGVLIDFGLALLPDVERWTRTGAVVGSTAYMAPELIREGRYSRASDWYAWGVGLFTMLEGRPPYPMIAVVTGEDLELRFEHLSPDDPARSVLAGLLAPDPRDRPASWAAIHAGLASSAAAAQGRWRAAARAFARPGPPPSAPPAKAPDRARVFAAVTAAALLFGFLTAAPSPTAPAPASSPEASEPLAAPPTPPAPPASLDALDQALRRWEVTDADEDAVSYPERRLRMARRLGDPRASPFWERYRQALAAVVTELEAAPGNAPALVVRLGEDLVPRVLAAEELVREASWAVENLGNRDLFPHGTPLRLGTEEVTAARQRVEEIRALQVPLPLPAVDGTAARELALVLAGVTWVGGDRERNRTLATRLVEAAGRRPPGLPRDGLLTAMGQCLRVIRRNLDTCPDSARLVEAIRARLPDLEQVPAARRGRALFILLPGLAAIDLDCDEAPVQAYEVQALVAPLMEAAEKEPWLAQWTRDRITAMAVWRALDPKGVPEWHRDLADALLTEGDRERRARFRERRELRERRRSQRASEASTGP